MVFIMLLPLFFFGAAMDDSNAQQYLDDEQAEEPELRLPEFIAHRGASWLAPENTMGSIQLAWLMNVESVEFDVYLTSDGEIVVFHDRTTERIGDRDRPVEEQTLAELRELDYGSWKGDQWAGEPILTLEQALATLPRGSRMFVDVKSGVEIVEPMLEAFDRAGHHPHQMVVIAFSWEVAEKTKRLRPRTPVYLLEGFSRDEESGEWSPAMGELIEQAGRANLDGLNMRFVGPARDAEAIAELREAGLGYYIWTVNELEDAQLAVELGVDGITTDRPVWLKKQLLSTNGWRLMPRP
jgi:glycerophosphoryl diester phosphodiesterase